MTDPAQTKWEPPFAEQATERGGRDAWLPRAGDTVANRFLVERVIGGGGMGAVVAARHVQLRE